MRPFFLFGVMLSAMLSSAAFAQNAQISSYAESSDPVIQGAQYSYTALVANGSITTAATGVAVSLTIPTGTTFVSATYGPGNTACGAPSGNTVTCVLGTLPAGAVSVPSGAVNAVLTVLANTVGVTNSVVTVTSDVDTSASDNSVDESTTIANGADLRITSLTASPSPVNGGETITYTMTPRNAGSSTADLPQLVFTLPANVAYVSSTPGAGWSCVQSGQNLTCNRASAAVGDMPSISVQAVVNVGTGNITATATMNDDRPGATADPNPNNDTTSLVTTVNPGADVQAVSKTAAPSPGVAGQDITFTLTVRNNGPSVAQNFVVTDTLPTGWTYVSATGSGYSCGNSGQTVTCTRDTSLPVNTQETLTVVATAPSSVGETGTDYTNVLTVSSTTPDPNNANNSASRLISVLPDGTDLRLFSYTKQGVGTSSPSDPVPIGATINHSIVVRNNGPRAATGGVEISIALNANETFVPGSVGSNWSCTSSGQNLLCVYTGSGGALAVNANTSTLTFQTTANAAGTLTASACTGGSTPSGGVASSEPTNGFNNLDPNSTNDCTQTSSTSTTEVADLVITKTTSTPAGGDKIVSASENSVTYTLVITNNGPDLGIGAVVTDTVPGYRNGSTTGNVSAPSGFSCIFAATVSCTQNGGDTLAVGESRNIVITVNRIMVDTWTTGSPRTAASATNTANITSTLRGDGDRNKNSASDTVQIDPIVDMSVESKTVSQNPVEAGVNVTYTVAFRNLSSSSGSAENVVLTDTFDRTDFTFISAVRTPSNTACNFNGVDTITCPALTLMTVNQQEAMTVVARPNFAVGEPIRTFTNTASVSTTTAETNSSNNSRNLALVVNSSSVDLLVNKVDNPAILAGLGPDPLGYDPAIPANNVITYRTRISNLGPSLATGVRITDTYTPALDGRNYTFLGIASSVNGTYSDASCSGASVGAIGNRSAPLTIQCSVADITAASFVDVFWRFRINTAPIPGGETYSNVASVTSNETESNSANNTTNENTSVRTSADMQIVKAVSQASVNVGEPFQWTLTATNNGPSNAENVIVSDTLPSGLTITGAVTYTGATSGSCSVSGQVVTCSLGTRAPSDVVTITVPVRVSGAAASYSNTASVGTDSVDPVSANNTSTASVNVVRSSLAGVVFEDLNNDGVQNGAELGISGVTITVTGADAYGNPVINRTAVTSGSGAWSMTGLAPANGSGYTVTQTQPAGYVNGQTNPPAASLGGTYARGGLSGNSSYSTVLVGTNQSGTGYNFPEISNSINGASISGRVFLDYNNNGSIDGVDSGIAAQVINLSGTDGNGNSVNSTATTDGNGNYSFTGLASGTYTVTQPAQPASTSNGKTTPGTINGISSGTGTNPSATSSTIGSVVLAGAVNSVNNNFGELANASLSGSVWYDIGSVDGQRDNGDRPLENWSVEIVDALNQVIATGTTASDGRYTLNNLPAGTELQVRFREPGSGVLYGFPVSGETGTATAACDTTNAMNNGTASSCRDTGPISQLRVVLPPGGTLTQQSLPVDPSGVVYNAVTRQAVPGAVVTLAPVGSCPGYVPASQVLNAGSGYIISGSSISMTTGSDGLYQFFFLPSAPNSCQFSLSVTPPSSALVFPSSAIEPQATALDPPNTPGSSLEVQPQASAPQGSQSTTYYLSVFSGSGKANVLHNHIPLDPTNGLNNALSLTKTGDRRTVAVGDTVRYTLVVRLNTGATYQRLTIVDRLPPGLSLIRGTAQVDGAALADSDNNPQPAKGQSGANGPTLAFNLGPISQNQSITLTYRVRVGAGAMQGDGINRAAAYACGSDGLSAAPSSCVNGGFAPNADALVSNPARYQVIVQGGVFTNDACVLGKIFVDCNHNQLQDAEELGIPGVRFYLQNGRYVISDSEGKYSLCGLLPNSHVLKADASTLPRGARLITSSNRNLGDANSLWLDLKNGELHRADFIEGSCSNTVLEQVKARRTQGEIRAPETETDKPLRFESKPLGWPQQGTDSAQQAIVQPRVFPPASSSTPPSVPSSVVQPAQAQP